MPPSGNGHKQALHFQHPPQRVVSLVPSLTESMFELGLGAHVVGITDYCLLPPNEVARLPRLGGTKNPRLQEIIDLKPDLVLANQEENTPQAVQALEAAGLRVWVSFPKTVRQAMDVLWVLVGLYQSSVAAIRLEILEKTLNWAEASLAQRQPWRYFCPIWQSHAEETALPAWWMTFNQDTYMSDLLHLFDGQNVFAERQRRYPLDADLGQVEPQDPGERDIRYPRVTQEEVLAARPEVILLPSEPYEYNQAERQLILDVFQDTPAVQREHVILVNGSLLTWHGTRLAHALSDLPALFAEF